MLVLSCVRRLGKAVFKVGTEEHFGKESLLEVECTPADGELQAHSIGVQIYLLQCHYKCSLLP